MATYAIGDVQGCAAQLKHLVDRLRFDPGTDQLWFVGDLVNRGPDSLSVLRFVRELGPAAHVVLGNHDLFLLAAAADIVPVRKKDTLQDVLAAEDRSPLLEWLRHRPLHHRENSFLMVHAGLLPQWTVDEAIGLAREAEIVLAGPDYRTLLHHFFHGPVRQWSPALDGPMRLASIVRVLTTLRTCTATGEMSSFSGPPEEAPDGFMPWFRVPGRRNDSITVIAGHWAALGLHREPGILSLDSGCVWGRQLTAVRLEDRTVFQVDGLRTR
jgi:bis(5'-nucleosyl)-tetraphosphatase (symmetrical)